MHGVICRKTVIVINKCIFITYIFIIADGLEYVCAPPNFTCIVFLGFHMYVKLSALVCTLLKDKDAT
jgi:hypothetical protein